MKLNDLTGNVYGRLSVISRGPNLGRHTRWLCRCVCEKETLVHSGSLLRGETVSCGGCQRRVLRGVDYSGCRFGRVVVVRLEKSAKGDCVCRCDCGAETRTRLRSLVSGVTQSCGCLGREKLAEQRTTQWRDVLTRFWSKVDKTGPVPSHVPDIGPCWLWTASVGPKGYGEFMADGRRRASGRHPVLAHRFSYQLSNSLNPSLALLHRCDNPPCVNPAHLRPGTRQENNADMAVKDRVSHGSRHWRAILTECDIPLIRERQARGESAASVARSFGVSAATILQVYTGKTWRRVA